MLMRTRDHGKVRAGGQKRWKSLTQACSDSTHFIEAEEGGGCRCYTSAHFLGPFLLCTDRKQVPCAMFGTEGQKLQCCGPKQVISSLWVSAFPFVKVGIRTPSEE